jgi:hypothetical protein
MNNAPGGPKPTRSLRQIQDTRSAHREAANIAGTVTRAIAGGALRKRSREAANIARRRTSRGGEHREAANIADAVTRAVADGAGSYSAVFEQRDCSTTVVVSARALGAKTARFQRFCGEVGAETGAGRQIGNGGEAITVVCGALVDDVLGLVKVC